MLGLDSSIFSNRFMVNYSMIVDCYNEHFKTIVIFFFLGGGGVIFDVDLGMSNFCIFFYQHIVHSCDRQHI